MGVGYKMVYIRNLIEAITGLLDGEMLIVNYRSGKTSRILKSDKWQNVSADLKITRYLPSGKRCVVVIDTAEVESFIIKEED